MCAQKGHIGVRSSVPASVPKLGPRSINRQPTPTKPPIRNGPENQRSQARSVILVDLSKPPPSASRPPHRGRSSIRKTDTYTKALHSEAVMAVDAKCNQQECLVASARCSFWAHRFGHTTGHTRCVFSFHVSKTEWKRGRRRSLEPSPLWLHLRPSNGFRSD
jgi:hypothetical protein